MLRNSAGICRGRNGARGPSKHTAGRSGRLQATLPENRVVTKEVVVAWKETLAKRYAVSTVNGKLAALNGLFSFLGWRECRVKPLRRAAGIVPG